MKVTLPFLLLSFTLLAASACGPGELATPSQPQARRIISNTFPEAEVIVREVNRSEHTLSVAAEFNGADVTFIMVARDQAWEIDRVEQGGNSYTIEQLRQIADTMAIMREISDALEAFREATGQFPLLDDQVGLLELVPNYYEYAPQMPIVDAWDSPLRYRPQGQDYTITSEGPDRSNGTTDDIILITGSFVQAE